MNNPRRSGLIVVLFALASQAFFFQKGVHSDDPIVLGIAQRILDVPSDPLGGRMKWGNAENFSQPNPPGWPYILAATAQVFGWHESVFRILELASCGLFALGFFRLACRVTSFPLFWSIAVVFSPFVMPGVNLAAELPAMACCCWAMHFFLEGFHLQSAKFFWIAGVLAALAVCLKYSGLVLLPVFALRAWKSRSKPALPAIWIPCVVMFAWGLMNFAQFGRLHLIANLPDVSANWLDRLRILIRSTGGAMWLTFPWMVLNSARSNRVKGTMLFLGLMFASAAWAWLDMAIAIKYFVAAEVDIEPWFQRHFLIFGINGCIALFYPLLLMMQRDEERPIVADTLKDQICFRTWWLCGILFCLMYGGETVVGSIPNLLIFLAPCVLMIAPILDSAMEKAFVRRLAYLEFCPGLFVAIALSISDYQLANSAHIVAADFVKPMVQTNRTWILGGPSLWYYCEPVGGQRWTSEFPTAGDAIVVSGWNVRANKSTFVLKNAMLWDQRVVHSGSPLRTIGKHSQFYHSNAQLLPWEIELMRYDDLSGKSPLTIAPLAQITVFIAR